MKKMIILLMAVIMMASCNDTGFSKGQKVTVRRECIWASNKDTFSEMNKCCSRRDEAALERMRARGEVGILSTGETATVEDAGIGKVYIHLDRGGYCWVSIEFLR